MLLSTNLDNRNSSSPTIVAIGNIDRVTQVTNQTTAVNAIPNTNKCPKTDHEISAQDKVSLELLSISDSKLVRELNQCIVCHLCKGYLIDATTIIECLHSFCKGCILKYLSDDNQKSRFCPKCDVQIHKTKPKLNIRSDPTLQDIVYKLVPGLYKGEMSRRKEFYSNKPEKALGLSNEEKGEINGERLILSNDDNIQLTIEYFPEVTNPYKLLPFKSDISKESSIDINNKRRFLLCKAGMKVIHLKKFMRYKYDLDNNNKTQVDFFYKQELLKDDYTIMDLAYIYAWRKNIPIPLYYLIIEPDKNKEDYLWLFSQSKMNPFISSKKQPRKRHLKVSSNNSDKFNNKKLHLVESKPKDLQKTSLPKVVSSNVCPVNNKINNSLQIDTINKDTIKDYSNLSKAEQKDILQRNIKNSNRENSTINNFTEDDSSTDISETSYQIDTETQPECSNGNENSDEKLTSSKADIAKQDDIQTSDITSTSDNSNGDSKDTSDTGSKVIEICSNLIQKVEELQQNNPEKEKNDSAPALNKNSSLSQNNTTNIVNSKILPNKAELKEIKLSFLEEKSEKCSESAIKNVFKNGLSTTSDKEVSNQNLDTTNQCPNPLKSELKLINLLLNLK